MIWTKKTDIENRCSCGATIPRGYGYYAFGKKVKCFKCGKINKGDKIETYEEFKRRLLE